MNLFRVSPTTPFLETVGNFIIENFQYNIDAVKIIVPTRFIANNLQKIIVQKKKCTLLPDIVSYNSLTATGAQIFDISHQLLNVLSSLEEKIILAEIIRHYQPLGYNSLQSLKFAPILSELLSQFQLNKVDITAIANLPTLNQAEHWKFIYNFLTHAYEEYCKKIKALGKISPSSYQINILEAEKNRIQSDKNFNLVIAGFIGEDKISWDFLQAALQSDNNYIILPPLPTEISKILARKDEEIDNFYALRQLLKRLKVDIGEVMYLGDSNLTTKMFDGIINNNFSANQASNCNIEYIECEDVFEEAELIAQICLKHIDSKIAIIVGNKTEKEFYEIALKKYNLQFYDLIGMDLIKTNISEFIFSLSNLLCNEFKLNQLFILLKNSLIFTEEVLQLEQLLIGSNRFVSNFDQISQIVEKYDNNLLSKWWINFIDIIGKFKPQNDFIGLLRQIIEAAEELAPNLWNHNIQEAEEIVTFFRGILEANTSFNIEHFSDMPLVLRTLIKGAKRFNNPNKENIIICYPHEAIYLKFDSVIFADFSHGKFPPEVHNNPWFNQEMQRELSFYPEHIKQSSHLYNFYLLLHNQKIFITRAVRQQSADVLPSNYIYKLQHIFPNLRSISSKLFMRHKESTLFPLGSVRSEISNNYFFPTKLSATDIELLIRSPYNFYIKKILNLKKIDHINTNPKLSEFGNFMHLVIERYCKNYNRAESDKLQFFLQIGKETLGELLLPDHLRKIWNIKLISIAPDFIQFDTKRRLEHINIHSEILGFLTLDILDKKITITARADRIEQDRDGNITILDYKTGAVPTKQEVCSGLSPQLIIAALIAIGRGFRELSVCNKINKLIYVKIASSKPYVQTTELEFSIQELENHKTGLIKLLEYYINSRNFLPTVNLVQYNDYKHFIRE